MRRRHLAGHVEFLFKVISGGEWLVGTDKDLPVRRVSTVSPQSPQYMCLEGPDSERLHDFRLATLGNRTDGRVVRRDVSPAQHLQHE